MARIVAKFGGTSMGDLDRIDRAARYVEREVQAGHGVAVVVSAMSGETDRLVGLADGAWPGGGRDAADEYDAIVSSGEQVSAGLLALTLRKRGLKARSWTGWQAGMKTDASHSHARITGFDVDNLAQAVDDGEVAVVTGFQGLSNTGRIATLGRGGSDTSAVAVAAALGAERCDIYTDVDGVYTTDPRIVDKACRINRISYEEMLELASLGAKVLQTRSVELAMARNTPLRVLSSFVEPGAPNPGTLVCAEELVMEQLVVSSIAYARDEARVTLLGVPDQPGVVAAVFRPLAEAEVNVDMILQNPSRDDAAANVAFTVGSKDLERAIAVMNAHRGAIGFADLQSRSNLAKVSVVGVGMRSHAGVAHTMFAALAERGISIAAISTSEIKISVLIDAEYVELAVRALHTAYGLDAAA